MSPTMVLAIGCTPPAPSPWMARNATSCGMECANPHSVEPSRNSSGAGEENAAAAVDVGEPAVDRNGRRLGQHVGGEHPGEQPEAAEAAGDAGHRGGDDRGLDRRHETGRHAGGQDQLPARQRNGRCDSGGRVGHAGERRPLRAERYYQIVGHVGLRVQVGARFDDVQASQHVVAPIPPLSITGGRCRRARTARGSSGCRTARRKSPSARRPTARATRRECSRPSRGAP